MLRRVIVERGVDKHVINVLLSSVARDCMYHHALMPPPIPAMRPWLPDAGSLMQYLTRIDKERIYTNFGPLCDELQRRLSALLGGHTVVSTSSGTTALVAAIIASTRSRRGTGQLAAVPGLTFPATALAAELCGYEPYLIDIDETTWQMDPRALACHPLVDKFAIAIPVATFGRPVAQSAWRRFAALTGVPVAIDGAASLASVLEAPDDYLGTVPVAFSFHATKAFGTGEGGCVVTSDASAKSLLCRAVNFGFYQTRLTIGFSTNGKMSEYHAAVGLAELDGWTRKLAAFRSVVDCYRETMYGAGLSSQFVHHPTVDYCYPLLLAETDDEAACFKYALDDARIGHRSWYGAGLPSHPYYAEAKQDDLTVSKCLGRRLIGLPMAADLSSACVAQICNVLGNAHERDEMYA